MLTSHSKELPKSNLSDHYHGPSVLTTFVSGVSQSMRNEIYGIQGKNALLNVKLDAEYHSYWTFKSPSCHFYLAFW